MLCTYNHDLPCLARFTESSAALATFTCICVSFVAVWGFLCIRYAATEIRVHTIF